MLSDEQVIEQFTKTVSLQQWQEQAEQQRHQLITDQSFNKNASIAFGLVALATASGGLITLFGSGFIALVIIFMGGALRLLCELDKEIGARPLLSRRIYQQHAAQIPLELTATTITELLHGNQLITWIEYNGQQQMIESITVDPDAEETVTLASRMRVRNAAVDERLSDPQSLPAAPVPSSSQRQLLTDVLKQPLDDHKRQTLPHHASVGERLLSQGD